MIGNIGRSLKLEELRDIVVRTERGRSVFPDQVANVSYGAKLKRGEAGFVGQPAVIVSVAKQPGVDSVKLSTQVEQAMVDLNRTMPQGIKIDTVVFRQADFIETSIHNVEKVLLEAVAVVDGDRVSPARPVDQYHDARRARDCDRRARG